MLQNRSFKGNTGNFFGSREAFRGPAGFDSEYIGGDSPEGCIKTQSLRQVSPYSSDSLPIRMPKPLNEGSAIRGVLSTP